MGVACASVSLTVPANALVSMCEMQQYRDHAHRSRWSFVLDCLLFVPSTLFSWPASVFASANALAVLTVEPTARWLACGVGPSLLFTGAAFESERRRGLNQGALNRVADVIFLPLAAVARWCTSRGFGMICFLVASSLLVQRVNQILKKAVRRPRPPRAWSAQFAHRGYYFDVRALSVNEGDAKGSSPQDVESFPSGDGAQAGAFGAALVLFGQPPHAAWLLGASVAFGRCYFGNHWLSDSVAGVVQGYVCTLLLATAMGGAEDHGECSYWDDDAPLILYPRDASVTSRGPRCVLACARDGMC